MIFFEVQHHGTVYTLFIVILPKRSGHYYIYLFGSNHPDQVDSTFLLLSAYQSNQIFTVQKLVRPIRGHVVEPAGTAGTELQLVM